MQRPLILIILFLLASGTVLGQRSRTAQDSARQFFIAGTSLQMQGNRHAEAILEFQQALRYDSATATLTAMARSYYELRKLTLAEEIVQEALRRDTSARDAWELLAEIHISNGKYDDGVKAYEHVLYLNPSNRQLYTMGRLYEPRDAQKAIIVFERLARLDPNVALFTRIAGLYLRVRNYEGQIEALEHAVALDAENGEVNAELVGAYIKRGKLDEAVAIANRMYISSPTASDTRMVWAALLQSMVEDSLLVNLYEDSVQVLLTKAERSFRTDAYILTLTGAIALEINDVPSARRRFDAAALIVADRPEPLLQIAALYATHELPSEAKRFLETWRPRHPRDPRFTLFIGDCLVRLEQETAAEAEFYSALVLDSTLVEAWLQIALICENTDRTKEARFAYGRVLHFDPDNIVANNNLAYSISMHGGDLQEARELSWKAVQQNPASAAYLDTYAWVLFKSGEIDKALTYIKQAVETGGNATHYEHWGDILEATGDIDGAVRAWSSAMDKDPTRTYLRTRIDRFR